MVTLKIFVVLIAISASTTVSYGQTTSTSIKPRMMNGISADTMKRFPHHVNIQPLNDFTPIGESCGGSIISKQWILTSLRCVENGGDRLQLNFQKLNKNGSAGSYAAVVNNDEDSVKKYPTEYDDIAMIKTQFSLIFSDTVKSIKLSSKSPAEMQKKLGVLPGFDSEKKNQLTYGMLTIASNEVCEKYYGNKFDEFLNLCAKSNNRNAPCLKDFGSGLVVGWPANPELAGIYSSLSEDCSSSAPTMYTYIEKYLPWIENILGEDQPTTTWSY